ncbi:MAG: flavin reductase family protein [Nocardioides sp.]|nr:flavin reductase family protein [Nocardioides sp.]
MAHPRRILRTDDPQVNAYRWLTSTVLPRPIAWVSTVSADGVGNLAPHSFFTVACARPPIIAFSSVTRKDTLANVEATGELVVNVASLPQRDLVNDSSALFPAGVDETVALGIATEPSELVTPPRVADAPVALECRLHSTVELGDSTLVLAHVLLVAAREDVLATDGYPSVDRLQPLSRLGRNEWGLPPEVFTLDRPTSPEDVHR